METLTDETDFKQRRMKDYILMAASVTSLDSHETLITVLKESLKVWFYF